MARPPISPGALGEMVRLGTRAIGSGAVVAEAGPVAVTAAEMAAAEAVTAVSVGEAMVASEALLVAEGAVTVAAPETAAAVALGGPLVWLGVAAVVLIGGVTYYVLTTEGPVEAPGAPGPGPMIEPTVGQALDLPGEPGAAPQIEPFTGPPFTVPSNGRAEQMKLASDDRDGSPKSATGRVTEPIPGLYDSIDTDLDSLPLGWDIEDQEDEDGDGHVVRIESVVEGPDGGHRGVFTRSFDPATGTMVAEMDDLGHLPAWIPHEPELVAGRGMPTVTFLSMRQMKRFGIGRGEVKQLVIEKVSNERTIILLHHLTSRPDGPLEVNEAVLRTHSVSYSETFLTQSGHRIRSAEVVGGTMSPVYDEWMDEDETYPDLDALLATHGVARDELVLKNFDIVLTLEPINDEPDEPPTSLPDAP